LQAFTSSSDGELVFDSQLRVCWGGGPVARLLPSGDVLAPKVEALASDLLDGPAREDVRKRAAAWVETRVRLGLSELMDARATAARRRPHLDGPAARCRARLLCRHRLPAAGRSCHSGRHGRAPGSDGAPSRTRKPRSVAPRATATREAREAREEIRAVDRPK